MTLVAGVDSSTQSCKVVVRDAETGALVRCGPGRPPDGTEVDPDRWWDGAASRPIATAGGLDDVAAIAVGGQQHGMVLLDDAGEVVRPALLWNDTRSAAARPRDLVAELGAAGLGRRRRARCRSPRSPSPSCAGWPSTSRTPAARRRRLPAARLADLAARGRPTRRASRPTAGDASGTGYWSAVDRRRTAATCSSARSATTPCRARGARRRAADRRTQVGTSLGLSTAASCSARAPATTWPPRSASTPGPATSSCRSAPPAWCSASPTSPAADPTGTVAGFADATGRFLPLVCTLNAARVLDATARLLGVDHDELAALALSAPAGRRRRWCCCPTSRASARRTARRHRRAARPARWQTATPAQPRPRRRRGHCSAASPTALDALAAQGAPIERVLLIGGGGAVGRASRRIAPRVLGHPVARRRRRASTSPTARRGRPPGRWLGGDEPPALAALRHPDVRADPVPRVRERYAAVRS